VCVCVCVCRLILVCVPPHGGMVPYHPTRPHTRSVDLSLEGGGEGVKVQGLGFNGWIGLGFIWFDDALMNITKAEIKRVK
jgi:hypothetical protein